MYLFSSIDKAEFENIKEFISNKNLALVLPQEQYNLPDLEIDDEEAEEEDSDFNEKETKIEVSSLSSEEEGEKEAPVGGKE